MVNICCLHQLLSYHRHILLRKGLEHSDARKQRILVLTGLGDEVLEAQVLVDLLELQNIIMLHRFEALHYLQVVGRIDGLKVFFADNDDLLDLATLLVPAESDLATGAPAGSQQVANRVEGPESLIPLHYFVTSVEMELVSHAAALSAVLISRPPSTTAHLLTDTYSDGTAGTTNRAKPAKVSR